MPSVMHSDSMERNIANVNLVSILYELRLGS